MTRLSEIKRLPVDRTVLRLGREVATAANHLSRVLLYEEELMELDALDDYLRAVLLRLEESAAAGKLLR